MTNKNPFELRAEMLHLAKEYMDQQYNMNIQLAERLMEQNKQTAADFKDVYKMYSVEELMGKAKEMYSFVEMRPRTK